MKRSNPKSGWAPPRVTDPGTIFETSNPELPRMLTRMSSGWAVLTCRFSCGLMMIGGETGGQGGVTGGVACESLNDCSGKNASPIPVSSCDPANAPIETTESGVRALPVSWRYSLEKSLTSNSRFGCAGEFTL